jgi:hypothetical protein
MNHHRLVLSVEVTAGLFMPWTFAVRRNEPCRAAADRRLFPCSHDPDNPTAETRRHPLERQ